MEMLARWCFARSNAAANVASCGSSRGCEAHPCCHSHLGCQSSSLAESGREPRAPLIPSAGPVCSPCGDTLLPCMAPPSELCCLLLRTLPVLFDTATGALSEEAAGFCCDQKGAPVWQAQAATQMVPNPAEAAEREAIQHEEVQLPVSPFIVRLFNESPLVVVPDFSTDTAAPSSSQMLDKGSKAL